MPENQQLTGEQATLESSFDESGTQWDSYLFYNASDSPIVDFYINIAPPCGDRDDDYYPRVGSSKTYEEGSCSYKAEDGSKTHPDYIPSGFILTEYDVLQENDKLDDVEKKVYDYSASDLLNNYY